MWENLFALVTYNLLLVHFRKCITFIIQGSTDQPNNYEIIDYLYFVGNF